MSRDDDDEFRNVLGDLDIVTFEVKIVDKNNMPHSVKYVGQTPDVNPKKTPYGVSFILLDDKSENFVELDFSDGLLIEMIYEYSKTKNKYGTDELNNIQKSKLQNAVNTLRDALCN